MIKSFFLLGPDGEIVLVKHYREKTARSVAELFWSNVIKARSPLDVPPVLDGGRHFFIHIQRNGLFFLGVVQRDTMPMAVVDFLQRIYDIFVDYFGASLGVSTLKAQFAIVYQLLDELADYGVPFTTEPNTLRDIVSAPSAVSGFAASMLGQSQVADALPSAAGMDVDWRRREVKYRTNEMFVDLIESIHCIIDPNGSMVTSDVTATFDCDCRLSGMPDLTMYFNRPELMEDVALHRCVRYKVWEKNKQISFVPPDGKFQLLSFRSKGHISLPLRVEPMIKLGEGGGNVRIRVSPLDLGNKPISDVSLTVHFSKLVTSSTLSADAGRVVFDDATKQCVWDIGTMRPAHTVELSGTVLLPAGVACDNPTIDLQFKQQGWTPSGLSITELAVKNVTYSPFKGVRKIATAGNIEIRT